jgi:VWFA-related protein
MSQVGARLRGRILQTVFAGALCYAQAPPAPQTAPPPAVSTTAEVTTHDTPVTFTSKVNLVSVPVVVRDSKGHALGTLNKDDFQLFDKGKLQVITRFTVERSGTPAIPVVVGTDEKTPENSPAPPAPFAVAEHFIAYLFDDVHLSPDDLARVREAAKHHLAKTLDVTSRAAIYTTSGLGSLDFTDDQEKLNDALNRLHPSSSPLTSAVNCPDISYYQADLILNKNDSQALSVALSDAQACGVMPPNTPAAALQAMVQGAAMQVINIGEAESNRVLDISKDLVRRMSGVPGTRNIVLISPGFYLTDKYFPDEASLVDRAIQANVTIGTLDARGLYTIIPGGDASHPAPNTSAVGLRAMYEQTVALANEDILGGLADSTGGKFFHNDNGLEQGLDEVAARPEFVYVLGFSPQNLKYDGSYHALKVTLTNPKGFNLQARRGFYAPKHIADPQEEAKEEIREAVFSREEMNDFAVDLNVQFFKASEISAKLAVLSRVDVKHLQFRKLEDRNKDTLTITTGLFDRNGNYVSGVQKTVELNLLDKTLESMPASGVTVKTNFDVAPGSYVIRMVVRDSEGQTMAARNGVVQIQ